MTNTGGIGGFLGLESMTDVSEPLHPEALRISSARACLMRILTWVKPDVVYAPGWICPTVLEPMRAMRIPVKRYTIGTDLLPVSDPRDFAEGMFLLLNPFGLAGEAVRQAARTLRDRLIVDGVQDVYQAPPIGCWGFASARKFFGVPDGAFLWGPEPGSAPSKVNVRVHADHLIARALGLPNALSLYRQNEAQLSLEDEAPSVLSTAMMDRLDHRLIRKRRRNNYSFLHACLAKTNCLSLPAELPDGATPLCYPYVPPHEIPRANLHAQRIWIGQMWPGLESDPAADAWSKYLAHNLLPLPIDHRYEMRDMRVIVSSLGV